MLEFNGSREENPGQRPEDQRAFILKNISRLSLLGVLKGLTVYDTID